ncbi:GIY-YIG nuclease family protein [Nocardia sp. NPDC051570]|uniref:GIY-YIG nuclease family protein n=1 Tax=Nocardia sp. NPDC051570 TaxID=3364324 RepID=UPI00378B5C5F
MGRRRPWQPPPCAYIMASGPHGMLYVGSTWNLVGRVWHHKNDVVESHTKRHRIHTLVWYEPQDTLENAILRERRLKRYSRPRKIALIETMNPEWHDLYSVLL